MLKIGDAVVLSAYGRKVQVIKRLREDIGLVLSQDDNSQAFHVKWTKSGFCWMNKRDIKKLR